MLEKIMGAFSWASFYMGGLRGDALFDLGDPVEMAILEGIFES